MKLKTFFIYMLLIFATSSCENDDMPLIPPIDGLSLYWQHEVFGDEGRGLLFEFYTSNQHANDYELVFNYSIDKDAIIARLVSSIDNGKCPYFPMPSPGIDDPSKCQASGGFIIPEDKLAHGIYTFTVIAPDFQISSELKIHDGQIDLVIPTNDYLTSSIHHVYPLPKDILFGNIVYQGSDNRQYAEDFFRDMDSLGLPEISLPNYYNRHFFVDDEGFPIESHWEPDNHSLGFLYKLTTDFNTILEVSKKHFYPTDLNIYLSTSNGDQALMNQAAGITVVFSK